MELKKIHYRGIMIGILVIALSFFFKSTIFFTFIVGMGIVIAVAPFVLSTALESKRSIEKEEMFLEFARNLVESVKMGAPISKSIVMFKDRNYKSLSNHIKKLGNQIALGIPLNVAMQTFSEDVGNKKISRAITLIRQAERSGGHIGEILESVAEAVSMTDKLKKERKAAISTLMIQGYIIFFVFIIIVLVMQFQILPLISEVAGTTNIGGFDSGLSPGGGIDQREIANSFFNLLLVQGFFSGLIIGKLAEGNLKNGVKHSFILMLAAFLISTGANLLFGA